MNWTGAYPQSPFKRHFNITLGKMLQPTAGSAEDELLPYLRAANINWSGISEDDLKEMWFSPADRKKYLLQDGDLVVLEGGDVGRAAIVSGILAKIGFQNSVHRVRPTSQNSVSFAFYWLQHLKSSGYFDLVCSKATLAHFTAEKFAEAPFPRIDLPTQKRIANFLDSETARIDGLIAKKERFAEVILAREEVSFLTAVTGKTAPGQKSPSGVDWIGDLPQGWLAPKFTMVARQETGHTPSRKEPSYWVLEECVIPWVSLADVWQLRSGEVVYLDDTAEKISEVGMANSSARLLPAQTVVLSRTASVGFAAILTKSMATTQDFAAWICGPRIRPKFLYYVLRAMKPEFRRLMMGSTHQTIYMPDIRSFRTPLPPLFEQDRIIDQLDASIGTYRKVHERVTSSIAKLREYRATLITAAVTGQIDVDTYGKAGATSAALDRIEEMAE